MNPRTWIRFSAFFVVVLFAVMPIRSIQAKDCQLSDQELAFRYAPVLYFHPEEHFRPRTIEGYLKNTRLRQQRSFLPDINVLNEVMISDLVSYRTGQYFLDAWFGSDWISDSMNYSYQRDYYQQETELETGNLPDVAYAYVSRDEDSRHITIQYWLFYYYNDWFNKHEGDWEMIEVILGPSEEPEWVVLSQHHGGTRRAWSDVQIEEETHPVVYVARGSHANYFWGNEIYPNGMDVGSSRVEMMDRTGTVHRSLPVIYLIRNPDLTEEQTFTSSGEEWIIFGGHWGETGQQGDFAGPLGPAYKGAQWEDPYAWGIAQPLDTDIWYANRLRVVASGTAARVTLVTRDDETIKDSESGDGFALLHRDPLPEEFITAEIRMAPNLPFNVLVAWPDPAASQMTVYRFEYLPLSQQGRASLTLNSGDPLLFIEGAGSGISPTSTSTTTVNWDAPDLVWMAGLMPASDILRGLLLCLLMGWLPALAYAGLIYWADRYEREPLHLVVTAFFWGAIPALLIAVGVKVYFQAPVDLLGQNSLGAIKSGTAEALLEESLKGAIILYIALRYRKEFDDLLDGVIYGGLVGIGFAMSANIISYTGAFLTRGFAGLSLDLFLEGIFLGLNHAFFSAIFGAGLGFTWLASRRWQRWVFPPLGFLAAVLSHILLNYVINTVVGVNLFTVVVNLIGTIAVILTLTWALRRQYRSIKVELSSVIPYRLYRILLNPKERAGVEWLALRKGDFKAWKSLRHLWRMCIEFAIRRAQSRASPEDNEIAGKTKRLHKEIIKLAKYHSSLLSL